MVVGCWGGAGRRTQAPGRAVITAVALVLMAATALEPSAAAGQTVRGGAGTLDPSFGTGGVVLTNDAGSHDVARDVLVLPDGRIVTAGFWGRTVGGQTTGDLGLARYDRRGRLDPTFGIDGRVATEFLPGGFEQAVAVLPGPHGRVVAVGTAFPPSGTDPRFALARYLPDGRLDPAFGAGGTVTTSAGQLTFATAAAVQADGRIVVAGYGEDAARTSPYLVLARYRRDGALDPTFGDGGIVTTTLADDPRWMARANDVAVTRDGSIVAVGHVAGPETDDWAVARFRDDGSPDVGFGDAGLARVSLDDGSFEEASAVALLPGGGIALVGYHDGGWNLARLRADGTLDQRFGDGGTVRSIGGGDPSDIVADTHGNLLVTGFGATLMRFRRDGRPDRRFGNDGVAPSAIISGDASAIAIQPDGAIVIAGASYGAPPDSETWTDVLVARYHG